LSYITIDLENFKQQNLQSLSSTPSHRSYPASVRSIASGLFIFDTLETTLFLAPLPGIVTVTSLKFMGLILILIHNLEPVYTISILSFLF
jgi:hypothetical protein